MILPLAGSYSDSWKNSSHSYQHQDRKHTDRKHSITVCSERPKFILQPFPLFLSFLFLFSIPLYQSLFLITPFCPPSSLPTPILCSLELINTWTDSALSFQTKQNQQLFCLCLPLHPSFTVLCVKNNYYKSSASLPSASLLLNSSRSTICTMTHFYTISLVFMTVTCKKCFDAFFGTAGPVLFPEVTRSTQRWFEKSISLGMVCKGEEWEGKDLSATYMQLSVIQH